jgi:voltage-gated sodium channel
VSKQTALSRFVEGDRFRTAVLIAVVVNALVLGLDTYAALPPGVHQWCEHLDNFFVVLFVFELMLKLIAWRARFFTSAWNIFDFLVVAGSLVASGPFTILRALRVLRTLRLVSTVPEMRRVVEALLRAIPGISAILGVLTVFFYVGAVLTTSEFGARHPELFGTLGTSAITLFQLMLFDNWAEVIRAVGDTYWWAPIFFVSFTVVTAFAVLNLFIAVMVDALRTDYDRLQDEGIETLEHQQMAARRGMEDLDATVKTLEAKVDAIMATLEAMRADLASRRDGR